MTKRMKGQALLLVLLSVSVVLIVALTSLTRSITDVSVSTNEEESLRAFSAAEAGVEKALIVGESSDTFENQSAFESKISKVAQASNAYNISSDLFSGETATVWLVEHDSNGNLTCTGANCFTGSSFNVCWGKEGASPSDSTTPAVEISIYYDPAVSAVSSGNYSNVQIARAAYDPNSPPTGTRVSSNNFSSGKSSGCSIDGKKYQFSTDNINLDQLGIGCTKSPGCLINAQIKPLYNTIAAPVGVDVSASGSLLPGQGQKIESVGTAGEATRKIEVFQTYAQPPSIFSSVIFSPSGVTK